MFIYPWRLHAVFYHRLIPRAPFTRYNYDDSYADGTLGKFLKHLLWSVNSEFDFHDSNRAVNVGLVLKYLYYFWRRLFFPPIQIWFTETSVCLRVFCWFVTAGQDPRNQLHCRLQAYRAPCFLEVPNVAVRCLNVLRDERDPSGERGELLMGDKE
jgi:hypothetical protein